MWLAGLGVEYHKFTATNPTSVGHFATVFGTPDITIAYI